MKLYLDIFITFFKIGIVSFGGGYAMIPIIQSEVEAHNWLSLSRFTDITAVSAMAPGPIATNSATIVGYSVAGLIGAVVACISVTLPSLLLILVIGRLFIKFQEHSIVKAIFYGLRPTIIGIIAYAAIKFALCNGIIGGAEFVDLKSLIIMLVSFFMIIKTKIHPVFIIVASGVIGMIILR
jgi:chromate transporter